MADFRDSYVITAGDNVEVTFITSTEDGDNNHLFDFGFRSASCTTPSATTATTVGTCTVKTPNDDAQINLTAITGDKVGIIAGADYTSGPDYAAAVDLASATAYNFTGLMHSTAYTMRVFNGADGCFVDYMVMTPAIDCAC